MRERGSKLRKAAEQVYGVELAKYAIRSMDIIGDIAIIKVPDILMDGRFEFAEKIIELLPSISTVFRQKSPVKGSYRLRDLEFLAGTYKTMTIHKEYGCRFYVDVLRTYYSPRLSTERWRITNLVGDNEVVINMFAGVGPYSIMIAKYRNVGKVYSIDINYEAYKLHKKNVIMNKVKDKVEVILGDAWQILHDELMSSADRILMPLPEKAIEYLDAALYALRKRGWLHIYLHIQYDKKEEEAFNRAANMLRHEFAKRDVNIVSMSIRRVREVATRQLQVCVDTMVTKE